MGGGWKNQPEGYAKDYYLANREQLLVKAKEYRDRPENKQRMKDYMREHVLGVTAEQYQAWVNEQEGKCAVCKQPPSQKGLVVDHNHNTGKIRGLLCTNCNLMLGHAKDNPAVLRTAAEYLEAR